MRLSVVIALILAMLAIAYYSEGAPAPLGRRERPVHENQWMAGRWVMHWNGGEYDTTLGTDGVYQAVSGDNVWVGHWRTAGRRLHVLERPVTSADEYIDFSVDLGAGSQTPARIDRGKWKGAVVYFTPPKITD